MSFPVIDERRAIAEQHHSSLLRARWRFAPILCNLLHSVPFGGSFRCATLGIRQRGTLESYASPPALPHGTPPLTLMAGASSEAGMAAYHRYHLDLDGHSITVLHDLRRHRAETWVDGKTVANARMARHEVTVMRGEIATDPPRPFLIRLGHPSDPGDAPLCALEAAGMRYLMPAAPLTRQEQKPAERNPPARTPGELLARWRTRYRSRQTKRHRQ